MLFFPYEDILSIKTSYCRVIFKYIILLFCILNTMYKQITTYFIGSLSLFILGIGLCCLIKPHGILANDGISYYGIFSTTLIPYVICLLGPAFFFILAFLKLKKNTNLLKNFLLLFSFLLLGLVITPYSINSFFNALHTTLGSALFALQLLLTGIIAIEYRHHRSLAYLWIIEFIAGVMCALYITPQKGYLLEYQVVFQIAFSAILLIYTKLLQ